MKTLKYILILAVVGVVVFFISNKKTQPVTPLPDNTGTVTEPIELCFGMFGKPNERGYGDVYTLRMLLDKTKATGELKFLPAEKDSKVGKFEGTVGPVDKFAMARTADLVWDTFAEGMNAKEELKINFGEGMARIGSGELVDKGDGVYVYADPENLHYDLELTDISCEDLNERENIGAYLKKNIATLSPVKPVLGGSWYFLSYIIDTANNSGVVKYEDGHIEEKRNFTYTVDESSNVTSLEIK